MRFSRRCRTTNGDEHSSYFDGAGARLIRKALIETLKLEGFEYDAKLVELGGKSLRSDEILRITGGAPARRTAAGKPDDWPYVDPLIDTPPPGAPARTGGRVEHRLAEFEASAHEAYLSGRIDDAKSDLRGGLTLAARTFGEDQPRYAVFVYLLAFLDMKQERDESAAKGFRRVLEITTATFGRDSPQSNAVASNLDGLYLLCLMKIKGNCGGVDAQWQLAPAVDDSWNPAMGAAADQHVAERSFKNEITTMELMGGRTSAAYAQALHDYGYFLLAQGHTEEAISKFARAVDIYLELGQRDFDTAQSLVGLAQALLRDRRSGEAHVLLENAFKIDAEASGPSEMTIQTMVLDSIATETLGLTARADELLGHAEILSDRKSEQERPGFAYLYEFAARYRLAKGDLKAAVMEIRRACAGYAHGAAGNAQAAYLLNFVSSAKTAMSNCSRERAAADYALSLAGGGAEPSYAPAELRAEAFEAAQAANLSAAGDALARSGALAVAATSGSGAEASATSRR